MIIKSPLHIIGIIFDLVFSNDCGLIYTCKIWELFAISDINIVWLALNIQVHKREIVSSVPIYKKANNPNIKTMLGSVSWNQVLN